MEQAGKTNEALEIRLEEIDGTYIDYPTSHVNSLTVESFNQNHKKAEKELEALEVEKEHLKSSIVSTVPITSGEDSEPSLSDAEAPFVCSTVGIHLEKFWSFIADYVTENWSHFKIFVYITLAALYNTYFIACIYYAHTNSVAIDWCDGVGLLILLTSVTYAGLFYYQIVKRFWGRAIYERALLPIRGSIRRIWIYRYAFYLLNLMSDRFLAQIVPENFHYLKFTQAKANSYEYFNFDQLISH